jgi:hypothetical protein
LQKGNVLVAGLKLIYNALAGSGGCSNPARPDRTPTRYADTKETTPMISIRTLRFATLVAAAAVAGPALAQTCTEEVGEAQAEVYVSQCLEVSPATRPPCNAENACELMRDEIARGCSLLGTDAPEYCSDYPG